MRNKNASWGCMWVVIGAAFIWVLVAQNVKADAYNEPVIPDIHRTKEEPNYQHRGMYWETLENKNCVKIGFTRAIPCKDEPKKIPEPMPLMLIGIGVIVLTIWKRK